MNETITEMQMNILKRVTRDALESHARAGCKLWLTTVHEVRGAQLEELNSKIDALKSSIADHGKLTFSKWEEYKLKKGWMEYPKDIDLEAMETQLRRFEQSFNRIKNSKRRELKRYAFGVHEDIIHIDLLFKDTYNMSNVQKVLDELILDGYGKPLSITLQEMLAEIDKSGEKFIERVKSEIKYYRANIAQTGE